MKNLNSNPIAFLILFLFLCTSCSKSSKLGTQTDSLLQVSKAKAEVQQVLDEQVACWNDGKIACYMEGYWKSDSLVFVGKSGLTYGWQQTLDNYKRNYPDTAAMGILSFNLLEKDLLAEDIMLVIGKWHLKREEALGDLQGHFSIVLKRFPDGWKIIADHSS